jgi:hypothetical protein
MGNYWYYMGVSSWYFSKKIIHNPINNMKIKEKNQKIHSWRQFGEK